MPARCATLAEVLTAVPSLATFGDRASGVATFVGSPAPGDTFVVGAAQLVGVAGARTPGANDWSTDGSLLTQALDFIAALNDPANDFAAFVSASQLAPGLAAVQVTTLGTGAAADLPWSTTAPLLLDPGTTLAGGGYLLGLLLDTACSMISVECWGDKASAGHTYLTAHLATVAGAAGQGGEGGPLTSQGMGAISASWATTGFDASDASFSGTKWGRMYIMLRDSLIVLPLVSSSPQRWGGRC
jgi:hypothetical protein